MQSVVLMSQLHAIDPRIGACCLNGVQFIASATSPPQNRKLSLTNGARLDGDWGRLQ